MSFIILGNQRSGTSYISNLIQQHPNVETIEEPFLMHLDFFRENEAAWKGCDFREDYLHEDLKNLHETVDYIRRFDEWLIEDFPCNRGFKETAMFEKYDWLKKAAHIDKTIILIRDFRAVLCSVLRREMNRSWWNYQKN